ncbi:MAG TPA: hypothetical protein VK404_07255 [Spirosoma sp.]|nr:hypothetical protein [Spirosoma sp.]
MNGFGKGFLLQIIEGYALVNGRAGFRASNGTSVFLWTRNGLNQNYYEQLLAAPGNAGQYGGVFWATTAPTVLRCATPFDAVVA